jgi:hypothetical protein
LLALAGVDRNGLVRQTQLFKQQSHFHGVGSGVVKEFQHLSSFQKNKTHSATGLSGQQTSMVVHFFKPAKLAFQNQNL